MNGSDTEVQENHSEEHARKNTLPMEEKIKRNPIKRQSPQREPRRLGN